MITDVARANRHTRIRSSRGKRSAQERRKNVKKRDTSLLKQLFIRNEQTGRIFQRRLIPRTSETSFLFSRNLVVENRGGCGGVDNVARIRKKRDQFDHDEGSMNEKNELLFYLYLFYKTRFFHISVSRAKLFTIFLQCFDIQ